MTNRITVREARTSISGILSSGKTVPIGHRYGPVRGFLVGVPNYNEYDQADKHKALKAAKAAFTAAFIAECGK